MQAEPYQRNARRGGYRNGYYLRDWVTAFGALKALREPRDRAGQYQTQVFERFRRHQPEVREAITAMLVAGVSQGRVAQITEPLLRAAPSAATVSWMAKGLQA